MQSAAILFTEAFWDVSDFFWTSLVTQVCPTSPDLFLRNFIMVFISDT